MARTDHSVVSTGNQTHLGYLDALRGYAITGVFLAHSLHDFNVEWPLVMPALRSGVTLFYVLSAYCLMLALYRNPTGSINWRKYCIKRFFRIAPLFYFCIIVWSLIYIGQGRSLDIGKIISSATFTNGFFPEHIHSAVPHGWSIAVETSFYAILPLLFLTLTRLSRALIVLIASIPLSVLISWGLPRLIMLSTDNRVDIREYTLFWLPAQMPAFLIGICAFHVVYGKCDLSIFARRIFGKIWLSCLAISVLLALTCIAPPRSAVILAGSSAGFLIILLSLREIPMLVNPVAMRIGLISFSLYLFHQLGINLVGAVAQQFHWEIPSFLSISVAAIISIMIASVTYAFIELPGIRYGRILSGNDSQAPS
jgi:peptidoglycan/LPS O-acetylase OafA/YrhL